MPDRRGPDGILNAMFEMVMECVSAIACGYKDAIDIDRLRHDPLMKLTVGRCPETGAPLASQSTVSRLNDSPLRTSFRQAAPATCRTRQLSTPRIPPCGLNGTSQTRSPPCADSSSQRSSHALHAAHAAAAPPWHLAVAGYNPAV